MSDEQKGRCAYEAWMHGCCPIDFVPWDRLDERDRQHHIEWAARYEAMLGKPQETETQLAMEWTA